MLTGLGRGALAALIAMSFLQVASPASAARWVKSPGGSNDFHIVFTSQPKIRCGVIITVLCDYRISSQPWGLPTIEAGSDGLALYTWAGPELAAGKYLKLNMNLDFTNLALEGVENYSSILSSYWTKDGQMSDPGTPFFYKDRPRGAAPEPSSWALMLLGLGTGGAMLRRRRRVAI